MLGHIVLQPVYFDFPPQMPVIIWSVPFNQFTSCLHPFHKPLCHSKKFEMTKCSNFHVLPPTIYDLHIQL